MTGRRARRRIAIAAATCAVVLTMGGGARAEGCFSSTGNHDPDYDNWIERRLHYDFDMTMPTIKDAIPDYKACWHDGPL